MSVREARENGEMRESDRSHLQQHSTRRRHSATEEMMEQLGPRPSLDALRLIGTGIRSSSFTAMS